MEHKQEEKRLGFRLVQAGTAFVGGVILTVIGAVIIPTVVLAGIGMILMIAGVVLAVTSAGSTAVSLYGDRKDEPEREEIERPSRR